ERDRGVGRVWVCVHAFEETLYNLPEHLRKSVTSKKVYADGKRVIFCFQDECIYRGNDDQRCSWVPPNFNGLKKKGERAGIMISGTIVDNVGFVAGNQSDIDKAQELRRQRCRKAAVAGGLAEPEKYRDISMLHEEAGMFHTYFKLEYGKNKEGYWTGALMLDHMAGVLDLLAVKFPNHRSVCFFDWSSCHDCADKGSPSVTRMNL
ncbi:unnamed protein product, partial [Pylaiella littoralis]